MKNLLIESGLVAVPLLLFSILSVALTLERSLFWYRLWKQQDSVIQQVFKLLQSDGYSATQILQKHTDLPIARIFLEALTLDRPNPVEFRLALESAAQAELPILRRFNTIFDTIVTASPLLGLLGTVLGLMRSFASLNIGVSGSDAVAVTGGISEALSSTVLGLIVALLTLFFSNTFRGFYRRQIALIQEYSGRLELLQRKHYEKGRLG